MLQAQLFEEADAEQHYTPLWHVAYGMLWMMLAPTTPAARFRFRAQNSVYHRFPGARVRLLNQHIPNLLPRFTWGLPVLHGSVIIHTEQQKEYGIMNIPVWLRPPGTPAQCLAHVAAARYANGPRPGFHPVKGAVQVRAGACTSRASDHAEQHLNPFSDWHHRPPIAFKGWRLLLPTLLC